MLETTKAVVVALGVVCALGWWKNRQAGEEEEEEEYEECGGPVEDEEEGPPRYTCTICDAQIHPDYCWSMESDGPSHEWVYVTHHCSCQGSDSYLFARYPFVPSACSYLARHDKTLVRGLHGGGWLYDNPVHLRYCTPKDEVYSHLIEPLAGLKDLGDIQRIWDLRYPL